MYAGRSCSCGGRRRRVGLTAVRHFSSDNQNPPIQGKIGEEPFHPSVSRKPAGGDANVRRTDIMFHTDNDFPGSVDTYSGVTKVWRKMRTPHKTH